MLFLYCLNLDLLGFGGFGFGQVLVTFRLVVMGSMLFLF
jgi:hypothetical protein